MTTLKEIHESVKILNPWIPVLSSSHRAFKDTDCIGYIAGCRSAVQRLQVEVRVQDTTGKEDSESFGNIPDGRGQGLLPRVLSYCFPSQLRNTHHIPAQRAFRILIVSLSEGRASKLNLS